MIDQFPMTAAARCGKDLVAHFRTPCPANQPGSIAIRAGRIPLAAPVPRYAVSSIRPRLPALEAIGMSHNPSTSDTVLGSLGKTKSRSATVKRRQHQRQRKLLLEPLEDRRLLSASIPLASDYWTALGPAPITNGQIPGSLQVSGRIAALAAHPTDANTMYVAAAGGGVWKTTDGGANWTAKTDTQQTLFMGAIAIAQQRQRDLCRHRRGPQFCRLVLRTWDIEIDGCRVDMDVIGQQPIRSAHHCQGRRGPARRQPCLRGGGRLWDQRPQLWDKTGNLAFDRRGQQLDSGPQPVGRAGQRFQSAGL